MSYFYRIKSMYQKISTEPDSFKNKLLKMIEGDVIEIDSHKMSKIRRDLEDLRYESKKQCRSIDYMIESYSKKDEDDFDIEEAKELRRDFESLDKIFLQISEKTIEIEKSFIEIDEEVANTIGRKSRGISSGGAHSSFSGKMGNMGRKIIEAEKKAEILQKSEPDIFISPLSIATMALLNKFGITSADMPEMFVQSEEVKEKLIDDTLDKILDYGGMKKTKQLLTEQQRNYLKQFIYYDDAGFAYINAGFMDFINVLDKKFDTNYAFGIEGLWATEETLRDSSKNDAVGVFYNSGDKIEHIFIYKNELPRYKENIALMNINALDPAVFENLPNTFNLFGINWFNSIKYEQILSKDLLSEADYADLKEMVEFSYDKFTQNAKNKYLIEQIYFSSAQYTKGFEGEMASFIPRKNLGDFISKYMNETASAFDRQGVTYPFDINYIKNQAQNDRMMRILGLIHSMGNNISSIKFDIDHMPMTLGSRDMPPIKDTSKYLGISNMLGRPMTLMDIEKSKHSIDIQPVMNNSDCVGYVFTDKNTGSSFVSISGYTPENTLEKHLETTMKNRILAVDQFLATYILDKTISVSKGAGIEAIGKMSPYVGGILKIFDEVYDFEKSWEEMQENNKFYNSAISNIDQQGRLRAIRASGTFTLSVNNALIPGLLYIDKEFVEYSIKQISKEKGLNNVTFDGVLDAVFGRKPIDEIDSDNLEFLEIMGDRAQPLYGNYTTTFSSLIIATTYVNNITKMTISRPNVR